MRRGSDAWIFAFLAAVLLAGSWFAAGPRTGEENKDSTTWNPDPNGVKAFYTLLGERLGYRVAQLRRPYDQLPPGARVLIAVQPTSDAGPNLAYEILPPSDRAGRIGQDEARSLMGWVRGGGAVVFFADGFKGVPPEFRLTRRIGKGAVYAFDSRRPITNRGMRDFRNAVGILRIIDRHAGRSGLVLFDEYHHGFAESRPLASYVGRHVWLALGILAAAGLILCHTYGKRFGAVRSLPSRETARPAFEFVTALARFYRRAGATDLAADIIRKLGPDGSSDRSGIFQAQPSEFSAAGQRPSEQELVAVANRIYELEEERGIGRKRG